MNYDDGAFVFDEPHVAGGFCWSGIVWALAKGPRGEWCPLTMLSHMLDCQLFGLWPGGHHLTNVLLHAASAAMLLLVWWRMTRRPDHDTLWPSALVAALFALHPLRVESVAWSAERRDVLSGFFFMLILAAYGEYVRRPRSPWRYLAVAVLLALGLLAKSMLVTVPCLLLLLDWWPLGRFGTTADRLLGQAECQAALRESPTWLVVEKLPLFALSIAAAVMAKLHHFGPTVDPLSLSERLGNAAVSCVAHLGQFFVPAGLSVFYAYPEAGWGAWQVAGAAALVLVISAAAVMLRRSCPYLFAGWFWYVGMLVPVLGLVYVAGHARADRYTYLPQIGLDVGLVWGAMRLAAPSPARRYVLTVGAGLVLVAVGTCTWRQTGYWQSEEMLWRHALDLDPENCTAHYMLGAVLIPTDPAAAAAAIRPGRSDRSAAAEYLRWDSAHKPTVP